MNENAYTVTGKLATYHVTPIDHYRARIETAEPFTVNNISYEFDYATIEYRPERSYDTSGDLPECVSFSYGDGGNSRPIQRTGTMIPPTDKAHKTIMGDLNAVVLPLFKRDDFTRAGVIAALTIAATHAQDNAQRRREIAADQLATADRYQAEAVKYDQRAQALAMSSATADELRAAVNEYDPRQWDNNVRSESQNYTRFMINRTYASHDSGEKQFVTAWQIMKATERSSLAPVDIFAEPARIK